MKLIIHVTLLALLALNLAVPLASAGTLSQLEKSVVEYNLPNGMKWLLVKRGSAPVFAGLIQVKVGGVDEEVGKTGLAHFLEHMAFKGTKDISPEQLWNAFDTNGASNLNAHTNKDETSYYAKMPSSKLELWIYLNSEMIKHSVMRDFFKERDVVTEELLGSVENNPFGKMYTTLLDTAFDDGPYKWTTIGRKEDVIKLKPEDLAAFKKKYYIPSRMTGVIVGNIDIQVTENLISKYFGDIPAKKSPVQKIPVQVPQKEKRLAKVKFSAEPRFIVAYHKPTIPSFDDYVFDLMNYILCNRENSRLRKELVFNKKLVQGVECDSSIPGGRLDNLFLVVADPLKEKLYNDVESAIDKELNRLKEEKVTEKELTTAKNNVQKELLFSLANNEGIAHSLAFYQTMTGNWRLLIKGIDIINKITAEDIVNTAKKYFTEENKTVVEIVK